MTEDEEEGGLGILWTLVIKSYGPTHVWVEIIL